MFGVVIIGLMLIAGFAALGGWFIAIAGGVGLCWIGLAIEKTRWFDNAAATLGGLLVILVIAVAVLSWTGIVPFAMSYD